MLDAASFRNMLREVAPRTIEDIEQLIAPWADKILLNLERTTSKSTFPKTVNDPVWGVVELFPWEVALVDSPLVQRLRGVRQLGLASTVYPAAGHSRFEHSLGVLEAAERMMRALERNAAHHRRFGSDQDPDVPVVGEFDRYSIRVAALLHDTGHGPLSHVSEPALLGAFDPAEYANVVQHLRQFEGVTKVAPAELVSALFVLSGSMKRIFEHPNFSTAPDKTEVPFAVVSRILGARSFLKAGYLSGILSGPLDADKLDYMARDSLHAGLPIGLDLERLISKLEVVIITPENAHVQELRDRAAAEPRRRIYELGISLAGVGAYEQSVVGRVILYDRLYHHHKIRAAESMARRLISVCVKRNSYPTTLPAFYSAVSDESFLASLIDDSGAEPGTRKLVERIRFRELYYRAFAFASRFLPLRGLPEEEQKESRILLWNPVVKAVRDDSSNAKLTSDILDLCRQIGKVVPELQRSGESIEEDDVIIDFPINKAVVRGNDILTRTESGHVAIPNLYFDAEGWSKAYESQKQVGYVFSPREHRALVALASRVVFYEKLQLATTGEGERASKTVNLVKPDWIEAVVKAGLCSAQCAEVISNPHVVLVPIRETDVPVPETWRVLDPTFSKRIAEGLIDAFPGGLPGSIVQRIYDIFAHLTGFVDVCEKGAVLESGDLERQVQEALRNHLRSRDVEVLEGAEFGGGETDLLCGPGPFWAVIENKIAGQTDKPFEAKQNSPAQARRYAISVLQRVSFIVVGYTPKSENGLLSQPSRVRVVTAGPATDTHASVVFVLPYGQPSPSKAKFPPL